MFRLKWCALYCLVSALPLDSEILDLTQTGRAPASHLLGAGQLTPGVAQRAKYLATEIILDYV